MTITAIRTEKAHEKYSWILLFLVGVFGLQSAVGFFVSANSLGTITGLGWDASSAQAQVAAEWLRTISQWIFFSSIVFTIIAAIPYKRGEKWSWYAMWMLPLNLIVGAARDLSLGFTGFWPLWYPLVIVPIIVAVLGLLVPYRKFFPRKQA